MKIYKIKTGYKEFADALLKLGNEVIAPKIVRNALLFSKIEAAEEIIEPGEYINTVRSAKEFMFPLTEPVLQFKFSGQDVKVNNYEPEKKERVIIGLRPCDASAFNITDDIFNYEYKDEFYNQRRESSILIAAACEKSDEACFCSSTGIGPESAEGSDILLKKNRAGEWFALVNSEKGERISNALEGILETIIEITDESPAYKVVKENMRPELNLEKVRTWLENNFNSEKWDIYASRCLGCASCAFLCPTCHCFDIVDEVKYDKGLRRKNWDACQFPVFTLHASGHNPRDTQSKRYRQRVMHKFKYYHERFQKTLCTGCGRCVRACPVNLDIYQVVSELTK
ncbi:MAG: 4Fe-4S dicluster domain-containing protein [Syntrophothermus sp.]